MKRQGWIIFVSFLGCQGAPPDREGQPLTEGQVNAFNNVGRTTGIFYSLVPPGEPDMPETLSMLFTPIADLNRTTEFAGVSGGLSFRTQVNTTADTRTGGAGPGGVETTVYNPEGEAVSRLSSHPPDPIMPVGSVSCEALGLDLSAKMGINPCTRDFNVALDNSAGARLVEIAGDPPEPDRPAISVRLIGNATLNVYDANGTRLGSFNGDGTPRNP